MVDLNDFIIKNRYKKKYKCSCDYCGSDRGFRYKEDSTNPCYPCSIKIRNKKLNHEPIVGIEFIKDDNGVRKYKASCPSCSQDRGYIRKRNLNKICCSCARKRHAASLPINERKNAQRSLRKKVKGNIHRKLKIRGLKKELNITFLKYLPYTVEMLFIHLESKFKPGMTWENQGKWHIDHVTPDSWFTYSSVEDQGFKDSWALSNLQPLWAKDNLSKSNRYSG